jgi:NADPH2:quinone reductase
MSNALTMRAAIVDKPGGPFHIRSIARPEPRPGEVLVRIAESGINPLDIKIFEGAAAHSRHPLPAILGLDMAGRVEAVDRGVTGFHEGDAVFGMVGGVGGHQGTLAEFAAVDADLLAPKPANLTMREAASLPLVFITAWEGLVDRAGVGPGQKVLVHGGGGGVGRIALQVASAFGAEIFATDSPAKRQAIEELGATFIDYHSETVADYVDRLTSGKGFDLVYDTVGGATLDASFQAVRRFGHVVSILGWGTHALAPLSFKSATYSGVFTLLQLLTAEGRRHHGDILRKAGMLAEAGKLRPHVDPRLFNLETMGDAYRAITERNAQGKLVVSIVDAD